MKNTKRGHYKTMTAAILAVSLAAMAGCGNDSSSGKAGGEKGGMASNSAPAGTYQSKLGPDQIFFLNFTDNNNVEATVRDGGQDESFTTGFVMSGDTVIVTIPEKQRQAGMESMNLKRNGEALEWTVEGMTVTFVKP